MTTVDEQKYATKHGKHKQTMVKAKQTLTPFTEYIHTYIHTYYTYTYIQESS